MSKALFFGSVPQPEAVSGGMVYDVAFQLSDSSSLRLVIAEGHEGVVSDFLSFEISRSPLNLKHHVRRIWFQYDQENSELLSAALLDLWVTLDGSGKGLFRRLLLGAKGGLDKIHFERLSSLYTLSEFRKSEFPDFPESVLNQGITGDLGLVQSIGGAEENNIIERDPLLEALECIEYSQIDQAQKILESALEADPLREALHFDLLELYKSTRNLDALENMRGKLSCDVEAVLNRWNEVAEQLRMEASR